MELLEGKVLPGVAALDEAEPLDEYCRDEPEADECRVYDD